MNTVPITFIQIFAAVMNIEWLSNLVDVIYISVTTYPITVVSIVSTGAGSYIMWKARKKMLSKSSVAVPADRKIPVREIKGQTEVTAYLEEQLNKTSARFSLRECLSSQYVTQIEQYFKLKKPYLDPQLTMKKVADQLNIPLHHLSIVLNDKFGHTFSDYVNMHRIDTFLVRKSVPHRNDNTTFYTQISHIEEQAV